MQQVGSHGKPPLPFMVVVQATPREKEREKRGREIIKHEVEGAEKGR